jgi:hypothetical protein
MSVVLTHIPVTGVADAADLPVPQRLVRCSAVSRVVVFGCTLSPLLTVAAPVVLRPLLPLCVHRL